MSRFMKVALLAALAVMLLCICGTALAADEHEWVSTGRYVDATCQEPTYRIDECTICHITRKVAIGSPDSSAHSWSGWVEDVAPGCETTGSHHRVCLNCGKREDGSIKPTGHSYSSTVTKEATCTESGVRSVVCANNAHHNYTETIPATGHKWDSGKDDPAATCTTQGKKIYTCTACGLTREQTVAALGHKWNSGTVTKEATCTEAGSRHQVCQNDPSHERDVTIPATGHKHTHWVVTKEPTYTEQGERQLWCDDCSKLIRTDKMSVKMFYNNTVCAIGPRLRDVNLSPYNSDSWYMFTPFDASRDGTQTYTLIASNKYDVGTATITVRDGMVTFDYKVYNNVDIKLEFFTIVNQMSDLHEYEPEALSGVSLIPGHAYSIADDFGGDTNLVLYFCSRADYTIHRNVTTANLGNPYRNLCRTMLSMMDK